MGLVAAVELFMAMDEPALYRLWHARIDVMKAAAAGVTGVAATTGEHFDRPNAVRKMASFWSFPYVCPEPVLAK
jgi:lysophospholipid acyltransferase (LPLAT)-like uncharacterized protein